MTSMTLAVSMMIQKLLPKIKRDCQHSDDIMTFDRTFVFYLWPLSVDDNDKIKYAPSVLTFYVAPKDDIPAWQNSERKRQKDIFLFDHSSWRIPVKNAKVPIIQAYQCLGSTWTSSSIDSEGFFFAKRETKCCQYRVKIIMEYISVWQQHMWCFLCENKLGKLWRYSLYNRS